MQDKNIWGKNLSHRYDVRLIYEERMVDVKKLRCALLTLVALVMLSVTAFANYPATMADGDWVLIDGGMGVGYYADKCTVEVQQYAPPKYQITIKVISVQFSDEYWREHDTYIGGPYRVGEGFPMVFQYDWDTKSLFHERGGKWLLWDTNRDYSHAEGNPMIPYAAEVAFVTAYNMRFFNDKTYYSPFLKKHYRIIDESLYQVLGI